MADKAKNVIRETDGEAIALARRLIRSARHGALAVIEPGTGAPFASRVATATDLDGSPIILVSTLSTHTSGLAADPRCSLLVGEPGKGDPLAHPRITVSCMAERLERGTPAGDRARRRYLNRHPKAKLYADFGDFSFVRLTIKRASLNGGFGKAYLLGTDDLAPQLPANAGLADTEQGALEHMNEDHRDAIDLYARHFGGARSDGWLITGIDAEGLDIASGDEVRRVLFPAPLGEAGQLRAVLVDMAKTARVLDSGAQHAAHPT